LCRTFADNAKEGQAGCHCNNIELFIESIKVKRVESCKFLGVYLDDKNDMEKL